jgi:hypothetical protein
MTSVSTTGKPSYYAWYEFYPEPSYYAGALTNLTPGHKMSAAVSYDATKNQFTATITDETEPSLSFSTTFCPTKATGISVSPPGAARLVDCV